VLVLANRAHHDWVTVYTAGWTFFQLPYGIIAVSIMSVIQPDLAEAWSRQEVVAFRRRLAVGLRTTMAVIIPATVGLILLAHPVVDLLLRHGHMTADSSHLTGSVVALFTLGLPGFCAFLLLVRAYQAMRDTRTVFYLYLVENGINIVFAFILYPFLGVRGLALSVAIAYTLAAGAALYDLRRRLGGIEGRHLALSVGRILGATLVMGIAVAFVAAAVPAGGEAQLAFRVIAGVVTGVVVYFGTAAALATVSRPEVDAR
jgi:putative peptidoglycan lipid II flippase